MELSEEDSEIWIVNLARKNYFNAKLDVNEAGAKIMTFKPSTDKVKKEVRLQRPYLTTRFIVLSRTSTLGLSF